jgi:hypothetical protein
MIRTFGRSAMALAVMILVGLASAGCVRRTLIIETEPQGALVFLNDEEIGRSPVQTDFLWYGDYDIVARREGYQTLHTHERINAPWYQLPVVDFFTELLYPGRIHDQRLMSFALESESLPTTEELLENAEQMRTEVLSKGVDQPAVSSATATP